MDYLHSPNPFCSLVVDMTKEPLQPTITGNTCVVQMLSQVWCPQGLQCTTALYSLQAALKLLVWMWNLWFLSFLLINESWTCWVWTGMKSMKSSICIYDSPSGSIMHMGMGRRKLLSWLQTFSSYHLWQSVLWPWWRQLGSCCILPLFLFPGIAKMWCTLILWC